LGVLAGHDPADPGSQAQDVPDYRDDLDGGVHGLRVAVCRNHFFDKVQPAVAQAVEGAIRWFSAAGAVVSEIRIPSLAYSLGAIFAIELSSSTAYHDASLRAGRTARYSPDVRRLVELGRFVTGPDYLKAEQYRHVLMQDFKRVFETNDVVIGPTLPVTAPRCGEMVISVGGEQESTLAATWRLTYPYNLAGLPAISLPCGFDEAGLPIGLQIAGKPFDETTVLRTAHAYEAGHDWKDCRPADPKES
ncbi:MAG: Asp-tRNA(Asn)/Glu-tRNA(Gln) amidotransferase GatCAB subunit A, partial [Acetobacteraceae bacterium]|nr:Asp-tRNA(Asn)/Glu-tRNA(Gln) amidotransferase GatCAB subunit A [Acetobacteraceae bacterium]